MVAGDLERPHGQLLDDRRGRRCGDGVDPGRQLGAWETLREQPLDLGFGLVSRLLVVAAKQETAAGEAGNVSTLRS